MEKSTKLSKQSLDNKQIEDNPVPSIDNKLIKEIIFCLEHPNTVDAYIRLNLIRKLQNGVETNNEQPIDKAKKILQEIEDKETCIKAGICNICGNKLKTIEVEDNRFDSHKNTFCSKNKSHLSFDHDYYYDDGY